MNATGVLYCSTGGFKDSKNSRSRAEGFNEVRRGAEDESFPGFGTARPEETAEGRMRRRVHGVVVGRVVRG